MINLFQALILGVQIAVAVALVLFVPGLALSFLLFPRDELDSLERFFVATVASIALSSITAFIIHRISNYLDPLVFVMVTLSLTLLFALGAWRRAPASNDLDSRVKKRSNIMPAIKSKITSNRANLIIVLVFIAFVSLILLEDLAFVDIGSTPEQTEFFIQPQELIDSYDPRQNDQGQMLLPLGVTAGQNSQGPFRIEAHIDGSKVWESAIIDIDDGASWLDTVELSVPEQLDPGLLHLTLFSEPMNRPIRRLNLWIGSPTSGAQ